MPYQVPLQYDVHFSSHPNVPLGYAFPRIHKGLRKYHSIFVGGYFADLLLLSSKLPNIACVCRLWTRITKHTWRHASEDEEGRRLLAREIEHDDL